jgi:hypothetical protein
MPIYVMHRTIESVKITFYAHNIWQPATLAETSVLSLSQGTGVWITKIVHPSHWIVLFLILVCIMTYCCLVHALLWFCDDYIIPVLL